MGGQSCRMFQRQSMTVSVTFKWCDRNWLWMCVVVVQGIRRRAGHSLRGISFVSVVVVRCKRIKGLKHTRTKLKQETLKGRMGGQSCRMFQRQSMTVSVTFKWCDRNWLWMCVVVVQGIGRRAGHSLRGISFVSVVVVRCKRIKDLKRTWTRWMGYKPSCTIFWKMFSCQL